MAGVTNIVLRSGVGAGNSISGIVMHGLTPGENPPPPTTGIRVQTIGAQAACHFFSNSNIMRP